MAKKLAIWNMKGGVGKTTTVVNVGYLLAQSYRVLLVDLDQQQNTASYYGRHIRKYTLCDVIQTYVLKDKITTKQAISRTYISNLKVLAASNFFHAIDYLKIDTTTDRNLFNSLFQDIESDYDYILFDCHPDYSFLSQTALQYVDAVFVPILLDGYSRDNLNLVREQINQTNEQRKEELTYHIFANRVRNTRAQLSIYQDLINRHDYPIMDTCISERAAVQNALTLKKPVALHRKKDQVTVDFMDLANEILTLLGGVER